MKTTALVVWALSVILLCGTAAWATSEPIIYPGTPHTPPGTGRLPFLSAAQLDALLANTSRLVDPFGTLAPDEVPPATPAVCGRRLDGTAHTVLCDAAPPLSGIVLVPPRRATASVVFLHGYTDTPQVYLTMLKVLLSSAPELWSSTRWVIPFAPRVPVQLYEAPISNVVYAWYDVSPSANASLGDILSSNETDVAAVKRGLLTATEDVDRLGLFLSTRRVEAIIAAEHRMLGGGNGLARCHGGPGRQPTGRVVLAGHSLGGVMVTHVALHSRASLSGVIALEGFMTDARRLSRVPGTYDDSHKRGYPVELVSGGADVTAPPPLVAASAAIVRQLLRRVARVTYTDLPGVTHWSFFFAGADAKAVIGVLRRYLE
ncbi:hypothetical protein MMPV_002563 [Pyropia vietnamensis]